VGLAASIVAATGLVVAILVLRVLAMEFPPTSHRGGRVVEHREPAGEGQAGKHPEHLAPGVGAGHGTCQRIEG
jgi:hypothetical protein